MPNHVISPAMAGRTSKRQYSSLLFRMYERADSHVTVHKNAETISHPVFKESVRHILLENQPNTVPEPLLTPMYARRANIEHTPNETYGRPFFVVRVNTFGALPTIARPSVGHIRERLWYD